MDDYPVIIPNSQAMFSLPTSFGAVAYSGVAFILVFFWEHFARVNDWRVRPSKAIKFSVEMSEATWELAGKLLAYVGGIFETVVEFLRKHLKGFREMLYSLGETLYVFWDLHRQFLEAPLRFAVGYGQVLLGYTNQTIVILSTTVLVASLAAAMYLYRNTLLEWAHQIMHTYLDSPDDLTVLQIVVPLYIGLRLFAAGISFVLYVEDWIGKALPKADKIEKEDGNGVGQVKAALRVWNDLKPVFLVAAIVLFVVVHILGISNVDQLTTVLKHLLEKLGYFHFGVVVLVVGCLLMLMVITFQEDMAESDAVKRMYKRWETELIKVRRRSTRTKKPNRQAAIAAEDEIRAEDE